MDAASGVIVTGGLGGQDGPVGVAGNQDASVFLCPLVEQDFTFAFDMIIFGGARGVQYAEIFQGPPDITDEET